VRTRYVSVNLGGKFILTIGPSSKGIMLLSVDALFASFFFFFGGPLHKYEKIFFKKKRIIT
jgi:hypothetical protein